MLNISHSTKNKLKEGSQEKKERRRESQEAGGLDPPSLKTRVYKQQIWVLGNK